MIGAPEMSLTLFLLHEDTRAGSSLQPRKEPSPEPNPAGSLTLTLTASNYEK